MLPIAALFEGVFAALSLRCLRAGVFICPIAVLLEGVFAALSLRCLRAGIFLYLITVHPELVEGSKWSI